MCALIGNCVYYCCLCVCVWCVCLNLNMAWMTCTLCDISAWATCSWSTAASERFGSAWLPQSWHLSACLLNCPFLNLIAASSNDNPQTMSNTDSSTVLLGDTEGRHRPQTTEDRANQHRFCGVLCETVASSPAVFCLESTCFQLCCAHDWLTVCVLSVCEALNVQYVRNL